MFIADSMSGLRVAALVSYFSAFPTLKSFFWGLVLGLVRLVSLLPTLWSFLAWLRFCCISISLLYLCLSILSFSLSIRNMTFPGRSLKSIHGEIARKRFHSQIPRKKGRRATFRQKKATCIRDLKNLYCNS